jgi:hypothetical protein
MDDAGGLQGQGGSVPTWARFMDPGGFQALVDLVTAELERRGDAFTFDAEGGRVYLAQPEGSALGLANLAQVCHQTPLHEWPGVVAEHVGRSLDLAAEGVDTAEQMARDFDRARQCLKVRLYPSDVGGDIFLTVREPMADVRAVLVFDMPETIHSVHQDHVDAWGRPLDELFAIALANVKAGDPVDPKTFEIVPGASVSLLGGGSFFTASHALFLGDYLSPAPEAGALVAVPHRHAVVYHPIADEKVMVALNTMIPLAMGMFRDGPGSVSPHLYWWRDGCYTHLPTEVGESTIEFNPPEEFVEVLNRLVS